MNQNQKRTKTALIVVTILVWAAAIATSAGKFKLAAKTPVSISLNTKPSSVKITINNEKQFDGMYADTPRQLKISPGVSKVKVSREGYISAIFSVDAAPGETINMNDVVLQRNTDLTFQTIEITTDETDDPIFISINNGFISGETPITSDDTVSGSSYVLTAYPSWPQKESSSRCRIKIPAQRQGENDQGSVLRSDVLRVAIKRSTKNPQHLNFKGCDKLKQKQ